MGAYISYVRVEKKEDDCMISAYRELKINEFQIGTEVSVLRSCPPE